MKLLNRISFDTLTLCLLLISISFDGIRSDDPNGSDLTSESISSHLTVTTLSPSLLNEAISAPLSVDSSDDDHSRSDSIVLKNEITSNNRSSSTSSSSSSSLVQSKQSEVITKKDLEKLATIINLDETKKSKLEILSEKLNKLADRIEKSDGRLKPELLLDEFIPDPLNVRDIKVEKDDWISSYNGHFTNVTMHGIRTLRIESIKVNIAKTNAQIELAISQIFLTGSYKLDGSVSFVDINGAGPFRFNISDMSIEAYGNLQRSPNGKLKIESIEMDINPNEVNLDLENFEVLGSEVIAQTIISTLSEIIFDRVKYTVIEKASIKIQSLINKRLEAIPWETIIKGDSEVIFDDIVAMVGEKIHHRINPISLPPFRRQLETKLFKMFPMEISFEVMDGKLFGLTTFSRMGDIFITYKNEAALIEAEVGFHNLTGRYDWQLDAVGHRSNGSSLLAINKVISYLRIRQQLKRGATLKLEEFKVKKIDHVWIEMKGLGVWDHLLEIIINSASNAFRMQIANLITSTVSKLLQQSLDRAEFSLIP